VVTEEDAASTGAGAGTEITAEADAKAEAESGEASPWDDPRLPWAGKPGRADIICWASIVLSGFFYLALLPFRASLVGTHPLLGTFLNGAIESIVAAAAFARVGHGSVAVVVVLAIPGLMKFDLLYWWAGRLWGERIVLLLSGQRKRGAKYLERVRRWGPRFSWPAIFLASFLPIPSTIIYVIAGSSGVSATAFIILDVLGTLVWIGMAVGLGYALGKHGVEAAQTVSHYGLWVALALIAVVILMQIRSVRMHR
jgi:membrane protein DedA with SNARE-associated domain